MNRQTILALLSAARVVPELLDRAFASGISAANVLMDSWFTHAPLIQDVTQRGLHVIGMVKNDNKRHLVIGKQLDLKALYRVAYPIARQNRNILRQIQTKLCSDIPVTVVFVCRRSQKNEWLAILLTDMTLTAQAIIQTYGLSWDIEIFFKCAKSLLRLQ